MKRRRRRRLKRRRRVGWSWPRGSPPHAAAMRFPGRIGAVDAVNAMSMSMSMRARDLSPHEFSLN